MSLDFLASIPAAGTSVHPFRVVTLFWLPSTHTPPSAPTLHSGDDCVNPQLVSRTPPPPSPPRCVRPLVPAACEVHAILPTICTTTSVPA